MIIKDKGNTELPRKPLKRGSRNRLLILLLLIGVIVSFFWFSTVVKKKGYTGLFDFIFTISSNYLEGRKAAPETISIEIKEKDFESLEKNREKALERGLIINDLDGDYVPATIEYKGKKIKVKLRLKGHMTDHLQKDKWSFRIKVSGKDDLMGMKRFSIQHPGTRGFIYEWIYHELMKREGLIALRYKFINVTLNGRDWGIYALEENFEAELIDNNNRKNGPILRFNPDLYWVGRYNEFTGRNSYDEFGSYYSANPEAYRESRVLGDSTQKENYSKAIAMIEGLRSGAIRVDQAFDVLRLAKFHAVIDLVGGLHSIDWSDIKYYFNPLTSRFEPIAYESFTDLSAREISGQYKFIDLDSTCCFPDWHTMIFSNEVFYAEYIRQLERICEPSYLDNFFADSDAGLKANLAIIYKEFPYKKFEKQMYYQRQQAILQVLAPPAALRAYLKNGTDSLLTLQVAAIDALPVQIHAVKIGETGAIPLSLIMPSKQHNTFLEYREVRLRLPPDFQWKAGYSDNIVVEYSILGSDNLMKIKVLSFPHPGEDLIKSELKDVQENISDFDFLQVDKGKKIICILPGKHVVDKQMVIPSGYHLIGNALASIDLVKGAGIISYSAVCFSGTEDTPFLVTSSDKTGKGILILGPEKSVFEYVNFTGLSKVNRNRTGALTFYESAADFKDCRFADFKSEDAVNFVRSAYSLKRCLFRNMENDAVDSDYSHGEMEECVFEECKESAADITDGTLRIKSIFIGKAGNKALNIKGDGQLRGDAVDIREAKVAVACEGHASVVITNITTGTVSTKYIRTKHSSLVVDDKEIKETSEKN